MQNSFKEQAQQISSSGSFTKIFRRLGKKSMKFTYWKDTYWNIRDDNLPLFYFFVWEMMLDFLITRLEKSVLLREPQNFLEECSKEDGQSGIFFS